MTDIIPIPSETLEGEPMTKIDAWSYSRLSTFEQCKLRAKLAYIDRIPEPERPLPPGKTEHANDRGTLLGHILTGSAPSWLAPRRCGRPSSCAPRSADNW